MWYAVNNFLEKYQGWCLFKNNGFSCEKHFES